MTKSSRMSGTSGRRRLRRVVLLGASVALPLSWLLTTPAGAVSEQGSQAASNEGTATVADVAEAWYSHSPFDVCTTPLGCPPPQAPTSPYPADTLHVGVAGGQETARTYLQPDLLSLPLGATATSGLMTLPVDTNSTDGTVSAESAQMLACLVAAPFTDGTAGASSAPPKTDCSTSVRPVYDAKKFVFTLDLTPFLQAWAHGKVSFGIALVPNVSKLGPTDSWHVTINGHKLKGKPHVQSRIAYTKPPPISSGSNGVSSTPAAPPAPSGVNPPPVDVPDTPASTAGAPQPAPVVAPTQQPAPQAQPVAYSQKFQYPLAFLAPIALLIGALFFVRLFTRDAAPRQVVTR
jgi:hypothetical protein